MTSKLKSRSYCFTINNYNDEEIALLREHAKKLDYLIFGYEVGENNTPHLQGYLFHNSKVNFNTLKNRYPRMHIEISKGTPKQNYEYCTKDKKFEEFGTLPVSGKRTDLDTVKKMILEDNKPMNKVINEIPANYQALRYAETLQKYQPPPPDQKKTVIWIHGKTGLGKTRLATEAFETYKLDYWMSSRNLKWWDGYTGQEAILIDDFRADFCTFHELLRILDRYRYRIELKGSSTWLRAKYVIITAPKRPENMYETREDIGQLLRRIDHIEYFTDIDETRENLGQFLDTIITL